MAINTGFEGQGAMDHGRRMVEEARAFKDAIGSQADSFTRAIDLRGRVQRNPLGMVLAAAGVGYLLGGGLFSPLTGRVVRIGLRLALIPLIKSQLSNIAGAAAGEGAAGSTF
ncbi:MAG TPA: hypothetical protein VMK66_08100 [Myxococcales bacterium]|nr:hypothetical protein [Myxococcales bacterium]